MSQVIGSVEAIFGVTPIYSSFPLVISGMYQDSPTPPGLTMTLQTGFNPAQQI